MKQIFLTILAVLALGTSLFAAVGCDLNDPDKDVKRLFPGSTGYKTEYVSISQKGGDSLLVKIEQRLGDKFQGLFETGDVPYTMYRVFRKKELLGYIHGVNQKGQYGGIQVFLVLDTAGVIKTLYFQKLTSKAASNLRRPSFGKQFAGLTLQDFYKYDVVSGKENGADRITAIKNPSAEAASDFMAALRAVKKNLILVDEFLLGNRYLKYYRPN
ncbi:hypothetical protein HY768_02400 [candidate division TA06 bacterium]|uniref:Lipoprotein n=1 Tax=candidate division TA06 bacterium TaxID=2250710 RepID=A0A933I7I7_UNCT6|nr:hypothetical protein [candidate division TA06 bacterium]